MHRALTVLLVLACLLAWAPHTSHATPVAEATSACCATTECAHAPVSHPHDSVCERLCEANDGTTLLTVNAHAPVFVPLLLAEVDPASAAPMRTVTLRPCFLHGPPPLAPLARSMRLRI